MQEMLYNTFMNRKKRYNYVREYYQEKFGERTLKICVDGGFTCPNRDGTKGRGGCIFCSEQGSGELIMNKGNITNQVKQYLTTYRAKRAEKFIVYFQNFTNTYDTVENLKQKYDAALIDERIVGLEIGTRPDCITEEIVKLLSTYAKKYYVCVELGLQTSNDKVGELINRKYTTQDFQNAVILLRKYHIEVVAHIMVGLPTETEKDIMNTVQFLNKQDIQGIKIHSTYVVKNTKLAQMYEQKTYQALQLDDYIEILLDIITHLRKDIVIYRISGDAPKDILIAPYWNEHKMWILHTFEKRMEGRDLWQGKEYKD